VSRYFSDTRRDGARTGLCERLFLSERVVGNTEVGIISAVTSELSTDHNPPRGNRAHLRVADLSVQSNGSFEM
jgi:hypothetical protein